MSYQIGQFRRTQMDTYYEDFKSSGTKDYRSTERQFGDTDQYVFKNVCFNIPNNALTSQNYYYLKFRVKQREKSVQRFYLKLCTIPDAAQLQTDQQQIIDEFIVPMGIDYTYFQVIMAPNTTYDQILWQLQRTRSDYIQDPDDPSGESFGRIMDVQVEILATIKNVIGASGSGIQKTKSLAKIGVQGPPSLLMCINGEQIRVGKSGIYEINNGIVISFIGFIPKESTISSDGLEYFIMDFEYMEED